ncbi:DUF3841 domain-containing protein [Paenibacillus glacialis]|uniref:DUF3841 domain-containing protein n=1 Tax=Paenibacillus glacialis TaxID=494026 RepID=A0A168DAF7_9BACL|nr:DUF3841 domain-containing protein [Paenibacillus glacialis]OAB34029.1 hypothetical protein PGLA_24315 [Paenibacillus glacialis]
MGIYWSLQTEEVWDQAKELGFLIGQEEYAMYPNEYLWMIDQMKKRIDGYEGEHPIWLWIKKPDMRSTSHFPSHTNCVRLTFELNNKHVLVSDFESWHMVLNDSFYANNEKEYDDFHSGLLNITKEESWKRIFDLSRLRDVEWDGKGDWLQGVTGKIDICKVNKVEYFVSRKQAEYML